MKRLLFILYVLPCFSFGQNLVPNFGFEQRDSCPTTEDQVELSMGWSKYSNNSSTPDYYACSGLGIRTVPLSTYHYQPDHRNCSAYMALVTWSYNIVDYREHVGIQLSQPLDIGQKYFISFYTVMVGDIVGTDYYETPSNNIGLRLSTISYNATNPTAIDNFTHIRSVAVISDTVNWIRISGSIVADSAYNYLMLGNFYDDANTDTTTLNCGTCFNWYSYYLIDDVCVSTDSLLCNGGIDSIPCSTSIREFNTNQRIQIYPNPTAGKFTVQGATAPSLHGRVTEIQIFDLFGRLLMSSNKEQIDMSSYPAGLYVWQIGSERGKLILE